jgi:TPR repeat protein
MKSLGYMYEQGEGVSQDNRQAKEWYKKAETAR